MRTHRTGGPAAAADRGAAPDPEVFGKAKKGRALAEQGARHQQNKIAKATRAFGQGP